MKRLLRFDRRPLVATGSAQLAKSAVVCLAAVLGIAGPIFPAGAQSFPRERAFVYGVTNYDGRLYESALAPPAWFCGEEGPVSPASWPWSLLLPLDAPLPPSREAALDACGHAQPAPPPRPLDSRTARPAYKQGRRPIRHTVRRRAPRCL